MNNAYSDVGYTGSFQPNDDYTEWDPAHPRCAPCANNKLKRMNTSFYNLVNRFRIEQAKKLLLDPKASHLSIEGIAYECGFKSRSTFFKFFKKEVGMTPTAFKVTNSSSWQKSDFVR